VDRQRVSSGSPYEDTIGFSRAVRVGNQVLIAATASIWPDASVDLDPGAQTRRCLEIIVAALRDVGAAPGDVVRTRLYMTDRAYGEAIGRAHGAVFAEVRPVTGMIVVSGFLDPRWKVEIEVEAVLETASVGPD
jgi:enamine deaminase RidA (YjgF/YER057c/UK114 family)